MLGIFHSIVGLCVYGGMVGFRGSVAHTLMRRYMAMSLLSSVENWKFN